MKVRHSLTAQDDDKIIECLKEFADYQPFGRLKAEADDYNDHHIRKVLDIIRKRGLLLLADGEEDDLAGVFMSIESPDIWIPKMIIMNELVWWVSPNYRDTSVGYRLLKEYTDACKILVEKGRIANFTMTLLENSPEIDLEKRGWDKIETNYVFGV